MVPCSKQGGVKYQNTAVRSSTQHGYAGQRTPVGRESRLHKNQRRAADVLVARIRPDLIVPFSFFLAKGLR